MQLILFSRQENSQSPIAAARCMSPILREAATWTHLMLRRGTDREIASELSVQPLAVRVSFHTPRGIINILSSRFGLL